MTVSIKSLLEWSLSKVGEFFTLFDKLTLFDGITILAFCVAVFILSYIIGTLIIRG